ncbi:MAG: DUF3179 domain-containing protein [Acidobacteria bacterium]|uniref:DUF3179 domain-containing protein n=1 Tax=Candidatus Polarisedimenticola svalbardensis TaxID=2886004 RepID=A0A8J6Y7Z9_9BACT|nr:DUF3179 domain-containing protein [Candidatus Polarisedimenticola svalbardensis]
MYVREIEGKETTFGVSGALWRDALIFFDRDTESYWSQIDGRSLTGDHKGKRLVKYPSVQTSWGEWKKMHPDTLVLKPDTRSRTGSPYAHYFEDPDKMGVLGTKNPDKRLPGKTLVLGIEAGSSYAAVPLRRLEKKGVLELDADGPVVAIRSPGGDGFAYRPVADGMRLHFTLEDGQLIDRETGSRWDPAAGKAVAGLMEGETLPRLDARKIFWFVWAGFHPETVVVK